MKSKSLRKLGIILFTVFLVAGCSNNTQENTQTYDGRVFDISVTQDKSLTATSTKVGTGYTLTISGSGQAKDYSKKEEVPWNPIVKKITAVTINEGIINIGDYSFYSLNLSEYILPSTVDVVGDNSFNKSAIIYTYGGLLNNIENDVYYYSENRPVTNGNYFHIVDGEPVIWILTTLKFLFIGNSFTYKGSDAGTDSNPEVPADFKKIATSFNIDTEVDAICKGSHTLTKFADPTDEMGAKVETALTTKQYDYVILQEQSTTPINNYSTFETAVKKLKKRIDETQTNCKTVLYETWGTPYNTTNEPKKYGSSVTEMEAKLREAYTNAGDASGCKVNYIGKAFTYAYDHEHIDIYNSDNRHQNEYGAYLSAASHIRSFFKIKVENCAEFCGLNQTKCKALLSVTDTVIWYFF